MEYIDCTAACAYSVTFFIQLVKYNLEKKVTEQERQLHLQTSSRDSYLSQVNQLDQNCSTALRQADDISEQMERLEANGIEHNSLQIGPN